MNDKRREPAARQKPEHTVRSGEVTASVYLRQSNSGFTYYDFALNRCWQSMATGKEAHGANFFERHERDLVNAIQQAAAWIRDETRGAQVDRSVPQGLQDASQRGLPAQPETSGDG